MTSPQILEFVSEKLKEGKSAQEVGELLLQMGLSETATNNAIDSVLNPLRADVFHEANPGPKHASIVSKHIEREQEVEIRIKPAKKRIEIKEEDEVPMGDHEEELYYTIPKEDYLDPQKVKVQQFVGNLIVIAILAVFIFFIAALLYFSFSPTV